MLGCDHDAGRAACTNPGGVGADRTGTAPLPTGCDRPARDEERRRRDRREVSEEGATLLKNDGNALPLTSADLAGGILVTGANANHTVADPTNEASTGFIDRDAVNPLQQLKEFSGNPGAFTFVPANDPTGQPVPPSCSRRRERADLGGLDLRSTAPPATQDTTRSTTRPSTATSSRRAHVHLVGYLYVRRRHVHVRVPAERDAADDPELPADRLGSTSPTAGPTLTTCSRSQRRTRRRRTRRPTRSRSRSTAPARTLTRQRANVYGATVPARRRTPGYTDRA